MTTLDPTQVTTTPAPAGGTSADGFEAKYNELFGKITTGEYVPKAVYVGLQQTHEKLVLANKKTEETLLVANTELETHRKKVGDLTVSSGDLQGKLSVAELKLERQKLVMSKFPALVGWEADGLLPEVGLEQLPTVLTGIEERLKSGQAAMKAEVVAGSSAITTGASTAVTTTAKSKLKEANDALLKGDEKAYNSLFGEYLDLKKAEEPKK